jgi:hypothetical protein
LQYNLAQLDDDITACSKQSFSLSAWQSKVNPGILYYFHKRFREEELSALFFMIHYGNLFMPAFDTIIRDENLTSSD